FQDVLIPVTSFFRDPKTFQTLCDTVFPLLFKNKSADEPIRVWIAGCSTGEEAFTIAICLHEFLGEKLSTTKIQIFASDISEKAIKKARAAIYTKAEVANISASQLNNYFVKNNGGYEVNKLIRDMCVFTPHNFLKDPPFAKLDLISCRNVLIYLDTFLQKKAFTTFHYALKENGFLLLGKSETTGASSDLFTQFSKHDKIYSRKPAPGRFMHVVTEQREEALTTKDMNAGTAGKKVIKAEATQTDFRKSGEAIMILKSPASVIVNEQMDIVHIHGDVMPFLQPPQGKPTHNLIKMAREGLAFELRNAIHKAAKEQETVTKENIPVREHGRRNDEIGQGKQLLVTIEIIPLTDIIEPHFLIRFEKKTMTLEAGEIISSSGKIKTAETQQRNEQLEKELSQTREDMRSITEDMEAGNEELQSANEELQSSNEEMQSLNEELETSKEELQSTNEELLIVNQELLDKQEQLNASRFYSEAIVTTMREPLVVLDRALRVKTANASFYKKFNVEENETEDKLFYELQNHQFDDTLLRSLLEKILPQKNRIEDFEIKLRLPDKGERIILINARQVVNEKKAEQLILLAMEDITDRVHSEKQIQESIEEQKKLASHFKLATDSANLGIWSLDIDSTKLEWSNIHKKMWGYNEHREDLTYEDWHKLILAEDKESTFKKIEESKVNHIIYEADYRIARANDGAIVWVKSTGQYQYDELGAAHTLTGISIDITEQKAAEKKIKDSEARSRAFVESNVVAVCFTHLDSATIFEANDAYLNMLGFTQQDLKEGKINWLKYTPPEYHVNDHLAIEKAKSMKVSPPYEKEIMRTDGKRISVIKARAIINKDEIMSVFVDITHRKAAEKKLKTFSEELMEAKVFAEMATLIAEDEKAKAETAMQSKQQFLSNMSHEIRTPMNAIIGFTKVLMKTDLNVKQKEFLEAIKSSGNTLIVLINDILDLAKVDAGKMIFINSPFKMSDSLSTILHLFETKVQDKKLELVREFDSHIPEILLGDSARLHQILINLLSNAIKFTAKGKITVSVNLLKEDKEKVTLEFNVTDTGIGIPQNKIAAIFEIFEQAHTVTLSLYGGTGLGLAIV
ncbi:MAG: PAS domain S-box protein, partial [Chitinophagales bacterium]|nr:PAS domain S-box protein [Chitinophagales bacterium]